jgi:tricarballylate dehydrogenase
MAHEALTTDVVVVGAGNSGLCAALAALEAGAEVIVLEKAPKVLRGGNTPWTVRYRFAFEDVRELQKIAEIEPDLLARLHVSGYPKDEFFDDLMRASRGRADPGQMRVLADESTAAMEWLAASGMRFAPMLRASSEVDGRIVFGDSSRIIAPEGGGLEIVRALFSAVQRRGGMVVYDAAAVDLICPDGPSGRVAGVVVNTPGGVERVHAKAVILACGGFEANPAMRAQYLGPGWDSVKIRGSRFNTGELIEAALRHGAAPGGQYSGAHATMVHASAPLMEMGDEVAYPHGYPFAIMVDRNGERFVDEGADLFTKTYAAYGVEVFRRPGGQAFQIFDARSAEWRGVFGEQWYGVEGHSANTLPELARSAGISPDGLVATVDQFNAAVQPGEFAPWQLDGKCTRGLAVEKSNWALPINSPPFEAFPVECGLTFTYGGLGTDENGQTIANSGRPIRGLYAVGETQGSFHYNYPGGSGLTKGTVFGRRAGRHAATSSR